jgi:hypothetical protein
MYYFTDGCIGLMGENGNKAIKKIFFPTDIPVFPKFVMGFPSTTELHVKFHVSSEKCLKNDKEALKLTRRHKCYMIKKQFTAC